VGEEGEEVEMSECTSYVFDLIRSDETIETKKEKMFCR
jgi:hypothetical protein